jgi:hypothetical protein
MATLTSPTLGKLIYNVRNLLGQPNPTNSTWTDIELAEYLNEAVRMYFAQVVKHQEGYFTTTTDPSSNLSIVSGTETVALPSDCFEVKAVYIQRSNGWEILSYQNNLTASFLTNAGASGANSFSPSYEFRGNSLVLRPTPNFSGSGVLRVDYVQFPEQMVNATDVMGGSTVVNQISPVFKQLCEMYAIWKAKIKQSMVNGTDLTAIPRANLDAIYTSFKDTINKRSAYPEFTLPFSPEAD